MGSSTFLELLRQSRLLTEEQLADVARRFGGDADQTVAESLVSAGVLTPYQARRLTAGEVQGLTLGQYRILDELGSGGFGQVFRALHTVMGRVVAVKVIAPQLVANPWARGMFKKEVQAATQLCHPNVVMAYDANEADGLLFLVMEYVDGSDLETVLRKQGPLALSTACEMLRQAAEGLGYAHERGMVHRDVKPANLLVPRPAGGGAATAPLVKVTDFGLARLHTAAAGAAKTMGDNGFLGTPDYVAPEQARNASAADARSDLYSLGCTFYHALSGRKPFRGETAVETLIKHMESDPEPLEELRPEVPPGLAAVVRRLMARDPAKRFQSAGELLAELAFMSGREGAAVRPAAAALLPPPARKAEPAPRLMPVVMGINAGAPRTPVPSWPAPPVAAAAPEPAAESSAGWATLAVEVTPFPVPPGLVPDTPPPPRVFPDMARGRRPADTEPVPASIARGPAAAPPAPPDKAAAPHLPPDSGVPPANPPLPWPDAELRRNWRKWTAAVEAVTRGDDPGVDEYRYRALHGTLLDGIRAHVASAGPRRDALAHLEGLVEPWVDMNALAAAPAAVAGVLGRARAVGAELFGAERGGGLTGWLVFLVVALLAGAAALVLRGGFPTGPVTPAGLLRSVRRAVEADPVAAVVVVVPVVLVVVVGVVTRRPRP